MDGKRWRRLKWIAACGSIGVDPPGKGGEGREMKAHVTLGPGIEPAPQRWEASAVTTAPSLLPHCNPSEAIMILGEGSVLTKTTNLNILGSKQYNYQP